MVLNQAIADTRPESTSSGCRFPGKSVPVLHLIEPDTLELLGLTPCTPHTGSGLSNYQIAAIGFGLNQDSSTSFSSSSCSSSLLPMKALRRMKETTASNAAIKKIIS